MSPTKPMIGPVLIVDDIRDGSLSLAALILGAEAAPPPILSNGAEAPFETLATYGDMTVWRARFAVPADRDSTYGWNGTEIPLASNLRGDLRLAFVSCNGEEHGDLDRDPDERNVMWRRLGAQHRQAPFAMVLHGGDQIYADEATAGHPLTEHWPRVARDDPDPEALEGLRSHLRMAFARRYAALYGATDFAWVAARVPALMQWDDHDICDGWGSLPRRATGSAIGQLLFEVAREAALVFQHAARPGDLPARFADPEGRHLGWAVHAPDLRLIAPDLRSQRGRRQVMGPEGWAFVEAAATAPSPTQTLLMSSVPLLGPRLSLLERLLVVLPGLQKYEDDLRDQWQSRAHRAAWIRMLTLVQRMGQTPGAQVTAISGEIHLATRAEMALAPGKTLHQLVASGVTHRAPPKAWARVLGALASLGEGPLPKTPVRIRSLPGQSRRYIAQRNTLTLAREDGAWFARWDLEHTGQTPPLPLL